jgi:hypothetical protein
MTEVREVHAAGDSPVCRHQAAIDDLRSALNQSLIGKADTVEQVESRELGMAVARAFLRLHDAYLDTPDSSRP